MNVHTIFVHSSSPGPQVDLYYADAPVTDAADHFTNVMGTSHWGAIQDLVTLR